MRLDPVYIALDDDFIPEKKFFLVSGNEKSFIERINTKIIEKYKRNKEFLITNIDSIKDYVHENGLFENKKVLLIKSCREINEDYLDRLRDSENIFVFTQENSQQIKKIKNIFLKNKDTYLIDCYELDKNSKIKILNKFIKLSGVDIEESLYWLLIEKLDNRFAFFENTLSKIFALNKKDITLFNIKKLLSIDTSGKEKVFFSLNKKNKEIVNVYREKIITNSDVNEFFYHCKSFCQLIINCENEKDYIKKIPLYLFKEKNFLIDIFRKYNAEKKKMLLKLLFATEKVLRKENELSLMAGLRFFLNIKKITIS